MGLPVEDRMLACNHHPHLHQELRKLLARSKRRFLHGMPHLYFKSFYEIGRREAKEAHALIAEQVPLLAA